MEQPTAPNRLYKRLSLSFSSLGTVILIAGLILNIVVTPVQAEWDGSMLAFNPSTCTGNCLVLTATLCNVGTGNMQAISSYNIWFRATGNPNMGQVVGSGVIPALPAGACTTITFDAATANTNAPNFPDGNYRVEAFQTADNPDTASVWTQSCHIKTMDACQMPTATLTTAATATNTATATVTQAVPTATDTATATVTQPVPTATFTYTATVTQVAASETPVNTPTSTQVVPTEVTPTEVTPTEVTPTEVTPTDVTPTEVTPTEETPDPTVETPVPTVETPVPTVETPVPTVETPVPTVETPVATVETPVPTEVTPVSTVTDTVDTPVPTVVVETPGGGESPTAEVTDSGENSGPTDAPTLPPPSGGDDGGSDTNTAGAVLIPVTGADLGSLGLLKTVMINLGLAFIGLGLVFQGLYRRML